jgi:hypothetical protein
MKNYKLGLAGMLALALTFGLVLTGCDDDDPDGGEKGLTLPGLSGPATGITTVTVANVQVKEEISSPNGTDDIIDSAQTFTEVRATGFGSKVGDITGGKLSLTLGTPAGPLAAVSTLNGLQSSHLFGRTDIDTGTGTSYAVTFDPANSPAQFLTIEGFGLYTAPPTGNPAFTLRREAMATDMATYMDASSIIYIYVDQDVTLSRAAKTWTVPGTDENGDPLVFTNKYAAISLPLKEGWNLVQTDEHMTQQGDVDTKVKIADKDVPWLVSEYGN